jgi:hypothetical protein
MVMATFRSAAKQPPRYLAADVLNDLAKRLSAGPISIVDAREFLSVPESSLSPD